jgi:arsenate reductase (thioredoxin)
LVEKVVLFICVENAARSLMAEAFFNAAPPPGWIARSAGTAPAPRPNPRTAPMLQEVGFALPPHTPRLVTYDEMSDAVLRVTMGCLDAPSCPAHLKGLDLVDWALPDPGRLDDAGFRKVRDEIRARVSELVSGLSSGGEPRSRVPDTGRAA